MGEGDFTAFFLMTEKDDIDNADLNKITIHLIMLKSNKIHN